MAHKQELAEETSAIYLSFHSGSCSTWHMRVSQITGTILGVSIIGIVIFWGLFWGPPILGNYHISWVDPPPCNSGILGIYEDPNRILIIHNSHYYRVGGPPSISPKQKKQQQQKRSFVKLKASTLRILDFRRLPSNTF